MAGQGYGDILGAFSQGGGGQLIPGGSILTSRQTPIGNTDYESFLYEPIVTDQGGGGGTYDPVAAQRAQQQSKANTQIDTINRLLGIYDTRLQSGVGDINTGANEQKRRLTEQRTAANAGYDKQGVQNQQQQARGYEQVDNFANNSSNSLNRVFQGANSGNSSVARLLAPHLVGKAAGSRRLGVTQTANENNDEILSARTNANDQFNYSEQDTENQRLAQERQLREGVGNSQLDLVNQRTGLQRDAGLATGASEADYNSRLSGLDALFGQYKPSYNVRAAAPRAVALNDYSVDPAQFRLNQNLPAETRYYSPQLKRKEQGIA